MSGVEWAFHVREIASKLQAVEKALTSPGPTDIARLAKAEGWSVDKLHVAANESTGINGPETVGLRDSNGEITTYVSEAESKIYDGAGLTPQNVNGRECLTRPDIDWNQVDGQDRTNLERVRERLAPLDRDNSPYQLHHVQQRDQGQLAELTSAEHQGPETTKILHDRGGPSEIDRKEMDEIRGDHWQARGAAEEARRAQEAPGGDSTGRTSPGGAHP